MAKANMALSNPANGVMNAPLPYDRWLVLAAISLLAIGILMVTSSSMTIAEKDYGSAFYYVYRQLAFLSLGLMLSVMLFKISTERWSQLSGVALILAFVLLMLVLLPGIGKQVNGSTRWIRMGFIGIQISEVAKLFFIVYLASYLTRHSQALRENILGFMTPMVLAGLMTGLLLLEPDFGASVVLLSTTLGTMFLAGMRLRYFFMVVAMLPVALMLLAVAAPYRLQRLTTFLDPWSNQFDSGYQLIQSLIAFGQGGWFGVGLGNSVQKLFYLPEAHTDFIFAVLAEEFGLLGMVIVLFLFALLIWRGLLIGYMACVNQRFFAGYLAYGCSLCFATEVLINIGVNIGVLPTKGLALPLMSAGGSSMVVNCVMLMLLLRVDYETRILYSPLSLK
jgi:cell division protein FtsW